MVKMSKDLAIIKQDMLYSSGYVLSDSNIEGNTYVSMRGQEPVALLTDDGGKTYTFYKGDERPEEKEPENIQVNGQLSLF